MKTWLIFRERGYGKELRLTPVNHGRVAGLYLQRGGRGKPALTLILHHVLSRKQNPGVWLTPG